MVKGNIFVATQRVLVYMKKALLTSRILDGTVILKKIPADRREAGISMLDAIQLDNYSLELKMLFYRFYRLSYLCKSSIRSNFGHYIHLEPMYLTIEQEMEPSAIQSD